MNKILVISVHPDDETLGCGGTILKHNKLEDEVSWIILTRPFEEHGYSKELIKKEKKMVEDVSRAYNFKNVYNLGFPASKLHMVPLCDVIFKLSKVIHEIEPNIIYTVNRSDIHTDHQVAAKCVISCTKSFRYPFIKKVLMYECISETEIAPAFPENVFVPNVYSDITDFIEEKLNIMKIYKSEIGEPPFPRSIENIKALARFRGSTVNKEYAESFMLVKEIV